MMKNNSFPRKQNKSFHKIIKKSLQKDQQKVLKQINDEIVTFK